MPDVRGRRKALIPAVILILCTGLGVWLLIREPATKRCARIARAETTNKTLTASAEVGPTSHLAISPAPTAEEQSWYGAHCSDGKPR